MTTMFIRNGEKNMALFAEEGVAHIAWTRQNLGRQAHDGFRYLRQFYAATSIRPKIIIIGPGGASEYFMDDLITKPRAVYPVWSGKHDTFDDLINLCENPVGESRSICFNDASDPRVRPVYGQQHKVVLYNNPPGHDSFWNHVRRFKYDYPDVKFHLNGSSSFRLMFSEPWDSVDYDPVCRRGLRIQLPGGNVFNMEDESAFQLAPWGDWINMLGFSMKDLLSTPDMRIKFNLRSATWASKHYADNFRWTNPGSGDEVSMPSENEYVPRSGHAIIMRRKRYSTALAEKILCNRCSIAPGCKLFRSGQICGLRESEMADLASYFQSRDAGKIVDGLAMIASRQARRLDAALAEEEISGEVDPNIDKQALAVFGMGVKLAKLVNPELAGPGTRVQVNVGVNGNTEAVSMANPKQMMANVIKALEAQGIRREDITPAMMKGAIELMATSSPMHAITSTAVINEDDTEAALLKARIESSKVIDAEPEYVPVLPLDLPL